MKMIIVIKISINNKILYPNYPNIKLLDDLIKNNEFIKQKYIEKINIYNNYINECKNSLKKITTSNTWIKWWFTQNRNFNRKIFK